MDPVQQVFNEFFGEARQIIAGRLRDFLMPKTPMFQAEDTPPVALPIPQSDIPDGTIIIKDAEVISVRKG